MAAAAALLGLSILVIGESHLSLSHFLVNPLVDDLTKQGAVVHSVGACGAGAGDWLKTTQVACGAERRSNAPGKFQGPDATTKPIKDLISADKPDVVVVIIGDTMASYDKEVFPRTWAWQTTTALTKEIASTKTTCVWVGPPWGKEGGKYKKNDKRVEFVSKFFAANVAPCIYVDSLSFSKPGEWQTIDGQHLTGAGYKSWSASITNALIDLPAVQALKKPATGAKPATTAKPAKP